MLCVSQAIHTAGRYWSVPAPWVCWDAGSRLRAPLASHNARPGGDIKSRAGGNDQSQSSKTQHQSPDKAGVKWPPAPDIGASSLPPPRPLHFSP